MVSVLLVEVDDLIIASLRSAAVPFSRLLICSFDSLSCELLSAVAFEEASFLPMTHSDLF